jgi:hypothetical protein
MIAVVIREETERAARGYQRTEGGRRKGAEEHRGARIENVRATKTSDKRAGERDTMSCNDSPQCDFD